MCLTNVTPLAEPSKVTGSRSQQGQCSHVSAGAKEYAY